MNPVGFFHLETTTTAAAATAATCLAVEPPAGRARSRPPLMSRPSSFYSAVHENAPFPFFPSCYSLRPDQPGVCSGGGRRNGVTMMRSEREADCRGIFRSRGFCFLSCTLVHSRHVSVLIWRRAGRVGEGSGGGWRGGGGLELPAAAAVTRQHPGKRTRTTLQADLGVKDEFIPN